MKKKILIVSMSYFPRFIGGAEVALKELTDRLGDEFEFHMVTLRFDSNLPKVSQEGNVLVHRIGFSTKSPTLSDLKRMPLHLNKYIFQGTAFLKARALHRKHQYAAVWPMMAHSAGIPGALFKRAYPNVALLLTLQEGDTPEHIVAKAKPAGPLFALAFRYADAVQVISSFLGTWAKSMGARRIEVIPNGADLTRFGKVLSPSRRRELRTLMRAKEDEHLLITASRLVPKNGVDLVIEALAGLPPRVRFAVAGDGPERMKLETRAKEHGIVDRVTFLGEVSQEDLPDYLASADIFIRASRSEGQGSAFIEAMASGLPTIGTRVGGIPDFLHDGETGLVIEPNDVGAIASAVRRVIEQPIETSHLAEGGLRMVRERYGWDRIAEEMRVLIRSLVS